MIDFALSHYVQDCQKSRNQEYMMRLSNHRSLSPTHAYFIESLKNFVRIVHMLKILIEQSTHLKTTRSWRQKKSGLEGYRVRSELRTNLKPTKQSAFGCVDKNERSKTYKSTPSSSALVVPTLSPKSIRHWLNTTFKEDNQRKNSGRKGEEKKRGEKHAI